MEKYTDKMVDSNRLKDLFEKYRKNKCSYTELKEFFELLKEQDSENMLAGQLVKVWEQEKEKERGASVDWQKMYGQIVSNGSGSSIRRWNLIAYAACFFFLIGLGSIWYFHLGQASGREQLSSNPYEKKGKYLEKIVPYNQTAELRLADGSLVSLNAGSHLYYPKHFSGDKREVFLEGEAYFDVARHVGQPFVVYSRHSVTRVLGTTFNVNAYRESGRTEVTVLSGKVAVGAAKPNQQVVLCPNQRVSINNRKGSVETSTVKFPNDIVAWRKGALVFDNATWEEIALRLHLRYGVHIFFNQQELANCRISAVFQNASLQAILTVVTQLTNTTFDEDDQAIRISGKGC